MIGHRIDGEVAARKVLFQCTREGDRRRMAMILVDAVCAEGGDLQIHAAAVQGLCAVLEPGLDQRPAAEGGSDFFGPRGRGDVVIVRHHAAQAVPHAAADHIGCVTVLLQCFDCLLHRRRQCHGKHWALSSLS